MNAVHHCPRYGMQDKKPRPVATPTRGRTRDTAWLEDGSSAHGTGLRCRWRQGSVLEWPRKLALGSICVYRVRHSSAARYRQNLRIPSSLARGSGRHPCRYSHRRHPLHPTRPSNVGRPVPRLPPKRGPAVRSLLACACTLAPLPRSPPPSPCATPSPPPPPPPRAITPRPCPRTAASAAAIPAGRPAAPPPRAAPSHFSATDSLREAHRSARYEAGARTRGPRCCHLAPTSVLSLPSPLSGRRYALNALALKSLPTPACLAAQSSGGHPA